MALRPLSSGDGRLRASFATACLATAAYSTSRSVAQNPVGDLDDVFGDATHRLGDLQLIKLRHGNILAQNGQRARGSGMEARVLDPTSLQARVGRIGGSPAKVFSADDVIG